MFICTERVVGPWNSLPWEVVDAETIRTFEGHSYSYVNWMGIEAHGPRKGRGVTNQMGSLVTTGLEGRRACSCDVILLVLCSMFNGEM